MVINLIGECDKRAVLYTLMKICQGLGDVLLITSSTRISRLSDTHETYGHYQNTMLAITNDGIDDFFEDFKYDMDDFEFVIIDNIIAAEADLTIYVQGYYQSESEKESLEYIEDYATINLYRDRLLSNDTPYKLEEFESYRNLCTVAPKVAEAVSEIMGQRLGKNPKNLLGIATKDINAMPKQKPGKTLFAKGKR